MYARRFVLAAALALAAPAVWAQTATTVPTQPTDPATTEPEPGSVPAPPPPAPAGDATGSAGDATAGASSGDEPVSPIPPPHAIPQAAPLTPEAQAQIGVGPGEVGDWSQVDNQVHRTLVPPLFVHERVGDHTTTAVFPFIYSDQRPGTSTVLVGPYFRLRSPDLRTDVAFPIYWRWRGHRDDDGGEDFSTLVMPPFYHHAWTGHGADRGMDVGFVPLFAYGESFGQDGRLRHEHLIIPPLLTYHTWEPNHALSITGPFFYNREGSSTDWGLAPLWFAGNDLSTNYLAIPLLLTYHHENHDDGTTLTLVGPFWTRTSPTGGSFNLAPIFFHSHDATSNSTTLLPLFHTSVGPDYRTLATPLWVYARSGNSTTFVTWLYQNHRGATNWDAVAPFFYSWRDPRLGAHSEALLPFFYHRNSPADSAWWVFPTFHHESDGHDWFTNAYPFVYTGREGNATHTVVAPFYFDFDNPDADTHTTVFAPLFWRFRHHQDVTQLACNVLWISGETADGPSYEWHILPFFSYARPRPSDVSWNVLFGLAGYRRYGTHAQMKLFWIPISLD